MFESGQFPWLAFAAAIAGLLALLLLWVAKFRLYDMGIALNRRNPQGLTPLMQSILTSNEKWFRQLMRYGPDLEACDFDGRTALMLAFFKGNLTAVNALLARGANIDATDKSGKSLLTRCVEAGDPKMVAALIAAGAKAGSRHLAAAIDMGNADLVAFLLSRDVAPGPDSLASALRRQDAALVDLLIARGADPLLVDWEGRAVLNDGPADFRERVFRATTPQRMIKFLYHSGLNYHDQARLVSLYSIHLAAQKDWSRVRELVIEQARLNREPPQEAFAMLPEYERDSAVKKAIVDYFEKQIHDRLKVYLAFPADLFDLSPEQVRDLIHDSVSGVVAWTYFSDLIRQFQRAGYAVQVEYSKCPHCDGKGEISDYSHAEERWNYSYPCSCRKGKTVRVRVALKDQRVVEYDTAESR